MKMKTLRFSILGLLAAAMVSQAQNINPGCFRSELPTVPAQTGSFQSQQFHPNGLLTPQTQGVPATPVAEAITPQIQALADGLQDDPQRIFDYVHDHIKFVLYFGSKKGAELTLLEKSGNDFDQSALLVALLSAAGYGNNVQYQFGWQLIPYDDPYNNNYDLHHWWQLTLNNTVWTNTENYVVNLAAGRGYPQDSGGYTMVYPDTTDSINGYNYNFLIQRTWVALTVGSTTYQLDPAFKISQPVSALSGFSLTNAMGSGTVSNDLLSAAGGTDNANYAQNLSESAVRGKLAAYTTNLLNYIQNNAATARMQDILGGWQIIPANNPIDYTNNTHFETGTVSGMSLLTWTYEPTNLMSTLSVAFAGTSYQWLMPQLQGQRLSLTFGNTGTAQLWQDDNLLAQGTTSGSGTTNVVLAVTHPIGTWNAANNSLIYNPANFANHTVTNSYQSTNATYAILYAFEPDWGWLQQRQNKLDTYLQEGFTNGSRQVTSETLNVMGLNWMLQTAQVGQMMAPQLGMLPQYFHRIGRMAQESGHGYYVDVYMQFTGEYPSGGNDAAHVQLSNIQFDLWSLFASSLEHGMIEQLQNTNIVAASTVKMLEIANTNGQAVYLASSNNWSSIQGSLVNYGSALNQIYTNFINQGYYVLMPANGSNHVSSTAGSWAGYGYEARQAVNGMATSSQMIIAGGYHGGYASDPTALPDPSYTDFTGDNQPTYFDTTPVSTPAPTTADPVDTANGTFQVENTDLSLGQAEPRGITLSRYYNGTRRFSNPAGMAGGWIHNYAVTANNVAAPQACLGGTTPAQAASMLTATAAAIATYNGGYPNAKNWLTTALIAKWGVDQLAKSGVSVNLGKDTLQFVRQPNGVFIPPANCTATLTQSGSAFSLLQRHANTFNFDSLGRLTNIVDQYSQPLTVAYLNSTSSLPQTVTDWKQRKFTFNYTGSQLTSVSDGTRTVSYGYSAAGDLNSFTDAEGKPSTYIYDTNHQITATLDVQTRLVVSNVYNTQGRLTTQYTQGVTNKTWLIYWSGWQTTEFDPAGGEADYFYDDQGRLIGQRDALNHLAQTFYDGQNHVIQTVSPLNETNQFFYDGKNNLIETIDPLGFTNQFVYDGNNNLIKTIDPRGNPSTFGYNAQFSLTGQTNGAGDWVNYTFTTSGALAGTLASRTDSGGTIQYGYDSTYGQLNSITFPGSLGSESFVTSPLGDVTSHTDGNGNVTTFKFNNRRQLTNSIAPTNILTTIAYDPVGNAASVTDPRNNVSSNSWSATRHLLATALPATSQGTPTVTNIYDNRDWLIRSLDPLHNPTQYTNDADGRLIAATDPVQRMTTFSYDADGRKLAVVNAANETNSQTWDARGSLIRLTDGAGHFFTRAYDAAGNQTLLTNRNGKKWQFQFDGANRVTNTISPLNHSTALVFNHQGLPTLITDPASQTTTNSYDAKGRLTGRADSVGTTTNGYDANDNLTSVIESNKTNTWTYDAYNRVSSYKDISGNLIQYRYDASGNMTNLIYPGGKNVFYAYDSNNHMTNVTDWAKRKTAISYDLDGHLTGITRPNGTQRTLGYDAAGQLTNIWEQMANTLPIAWCRFNWNSNATVQWEFAAPLPHSVTVPTRNMTYDDENRLYQFQGPTMGSLQPVGVDADGNLTSGPLTNDTFVAYTFDARNRLKNVGGVTNTYDAINNRIGQTVGTNTTTFVVNPNAKLPQVLMRIKNGVTNYYIYGAGLLYQVTETATATNTLTYHYDYRGSTIALSGDNGLVTDRIEYSAYGLTTFRAGTNDTPFLFNGRYGVMTDPNGLLYMRARYYNPYLCRFVSPDPSGFGGGLNFYAAFNGNPVSMTDPAGLDAVGNNQTTSWLTDLNAPPANLNDPFNLTSTGNSDNSSLLNQNINQNQGQPCIMCHGVSAGGFNGNVNSFSGLTAIPGSGPDAMQGYQALEQLSIAATPFVAGPVGGFIGDALDVGAVGTISAVAAGQMTLNEGDAVLAVVQNGQIIAEGDVGLSHSEFVARTLGTLPQGAEVVTIGKVDGQIVAITSKSFYGVQVPASANAQTAAQAAFR
jgi:RHS repeat-associated protein